MDLPEEMLKGTLMYEMGAKIVLGCLESEDLETKSILRWIVHLQSRINLIANQLLQKKPV